MPFICTICGQMCFIGVPHICEKENDVSEEERNEEHYYRTLDKEALDKAYKENDMELRPLFSFLKKRRCAQCWGPVQDRKVDDSWEIYCPKECEPGGHVSEEHVEMMRKQDAMNAAKVVFNYPELGPSDPVEGESESLFQEE